MHTVYYTVTPKSPAAKLIADADRQLKAHDAAVQAFGEKYLPRFSGGTIVDGSRTIGFTEPKGEQFIDWSKEVDRTKFKIQKNMWLRYVAPRIGGPLGKEWKELLEKHPAPNGSELMNCLVGKLPLGIDVVGGRMMTRKATLHRFKGEAPIIGIPQKLVKDATPTTGVVKMKDQTKAMKLIDEEG